MVELITYSKIFIRGWWIIALCALSALNLALALSYVETPLYRATASFIISPDGSLIEGRDVVNSLNTLDKRSITITLSEVLNSQRIYQQTINDLQLPAEGLEDYTLSAVVLPEAAVLELMVDGPDPELAALLANSVGQRGIDYINELYQVYHVNFLDPASIPQRPFSPQPLRNGGLAFVVGLVGGAALLVIREQLRTLPRTTYPVPKLKASSRQTRREVQRYLEERLVHNGNGGLSLGLVRLNGLQDRSVPQSLVNKLRQDVVKVLEHELFGDSLVASWDEQSLAVILPQATDSDLLARFEHIHQTLSRPVSLNGNGHKLFLDPHTGLAAHHENQSAEVLIQQAELALEEAQQSQAKIIFHQNGHTKYDLSPAQAA
jgi:capsular polysaccharide biosynthesis protein/GGDEF domain-containing protein